jgi:hypothetical protein
MIDDSEGLGTPHEAFCRIVAMIHAENPGLGKKVTGPHWHYEFPRDSRDALAIGNALRFLNANVSAGKISAQGIRKGTEHDGPKPINTAELLTGNLKVWDGTLECRSGGTGGRLYQHVFLSMADLNRALGVPSTVSPPPWKNPTDEMVRVKLRDAYSEEKAAGRRAPNINKISKFVRPKLQADGYDAADNRIKTIADEPDFKALREPTGVRAT